MLQSRHNPARMSATLPRKQELNNVYLHVVRRVNDESMARRVQGPMPLGRAACIAVKTQELSRCLARHSSRRVDLGLVYKKHLRD
jgi:hypothetical protein